MIAYKIELVVVDLNEYGAEEIINNIRNSLEAPIELSSIRKFDIGDWSDDHPLNIEKDTTIYNIEEFYNEE